MKSFITIILISFLICSEALSQTATCPIPPSKIEPQISLSVTLDKKTKIYTYKYKLTNGSSGLLNMSNVSLLIDSVPTDSIAPEAWFLDVDQEPSRITWSTMTRRISSGKSLEGFSFKSQFPPGLVRFIARGKTEVPVTVPSVATATNQVDDEPEPECPGFFYDRPWVDFWLTGYTQGPVDPAVQVSATLKIKYRDSKEDEAPFIKCRDKDKIYVTILGAEGLDVTQIDQSSIKFGIDQAQPVSAKIVQRDGDKNSKQKNKDLLLEFNVEDVGVRCELDRALFLEGKIGQKKLLAAAPIRPESCTKEHLKFERDRKVIRDRKKAEADKRKVQEMLRKPSKRQNRQDH